MWMLLRWSTPPGMSDVLLLPVRRRFIVVSLLPNAARNAKGNFYCVERLKSQFRDGLFDFYGIHG